MTTTTGTSQADEQTVEQVQRNGETFFKISDVDQLRPFFMSIVSDANHWLFLASNGGLTAGRKNAEYALFPYYTDDKITEMAEITGSKTILRMGNGPDAQHWEPFSERCEGLYRTQRNLYKNRFGNKVLFEEINFDWGITFQYGWTTSKTYGFVRSARLKNHSGRDLHLDLLDGLQNIMPYGVPSALQRASSNLVDAYKKNELEKEIGLGIYALSAIIVDKAEPSEALKANIAWATGLENPTYLLTSRQLQAFRQGSPIQEETDIRGEKGAYFLHTTLSLQDQAEKEWLIAADVNKNHAALTRLSRTLKEKANLSQAVWADIEASTQRLVSLTAGADGLQHTADPLRDTRHFSNTLFNIMRGGIFDHHYDIDKADFSQYLQKANRGVYQSVANHLQGLPDIFDLSHVKKMAYDSPDPDFTRLCLEYLPLKFSRRHGDPSRPWNIFSINTEDELDGSKILDYEGNWRDIFQNWEALAHAYPPFIEGMIHKFLNATTFDGYNPYRITKEGIDWETIEPDDPWSYIGYWGDHQIIYLLKFLEFIEHYDPGKLLSYFNRPVFAYANVPYRIKPFPDLLANPKDTIEFDLQLDQQIRAQRKEWGADGALLRHPDGGIYHINLTEKILATLLAKMANFVPEGGIWMNTQRPEWNDANNALVGNGVSMVTLCYLRRFLAFFQRLLAGADDQKVPVSAELATFFRECWQVLDQHQDLLTGSVDDSARLRVLRGLGESASAYRIRIYDHGFSGRNDTVLLSELKNFMRTAQKHLDHTIAANERRDHLFHAYNLLTVKEDDRVTLSYLSEMLEGQVAVLSSGYLSAAQSLRVLDALKNSRLFRPDQYSYLLYPDKDLPRFLEKNTVPEAAVQGSALLTQLVQDDHKAILERDVDGRYHFNGNFRNAQDLRAALKALADTNYAELAVKEQAQILDIFESVFNHKAFTGRSGTFFGYEGLGSIYWHMVSKLLLAVQEVCLHAIRKGESKETIDRLLAHFYEINEGIGVHKSPQRYGAFPTDPYSHTPAGKGAQQPGMTGQVKEDILVRFGELGVFIRHGQLVFDPCLLRASEFIQEPTTFTYIDLAEQKRTIPLSGQSLAFTICQVPIVYQIAAKKAIIVHGHQGENTSTDGWVLDLSTSRHLFNRTGAVAYLTVHIPADRLR